MDKNKYKLLLSIVAGALALLGIVLIVLGALLEMALPAKILLFVVAVLAILLAAELGYFLYLVMDTKPNFFLYDPKLKRNISSKDLTFQTVNSRLNRYLSNYAPKEASLWNDRVFDNPYLEIDEVFRPLIAYKMLFSIAQRDEEGGWKCFENASYDTIAFICSGIVLNGDDDLAKGIAEITAIRPINIAVARDYLVKNKKYIAMRMHKYVLDHIEEFYA